MKKYLIQKTIEAEPMSRADAEKKLGYPLDASKKDKDGFIICDKGNLSWKWVPESKFEGKPVNTVMEHLLTFDEQVSQWQKYFLAYNSKKDTVSPDERAQIYKLNRHMEFFAATVRRIINMNQLQKQ